MAKIYAFDITVLSVCVRACVLAWACACLCPFHVLDHLIDLHNLGMIFTHRTITQHLAFRRFRETVKSDN